MKKIYLIGLFLLANVCLHAQTNAVAPKLSREPTRIDSDTANFDMAAHKAIYFGHVRVNDPQMKLTCMQLIADLPPAGGRVNHIVAETNVIIDATDDKGQPMHTTSDLAIYDYKVQNGMTNETVTFIGHARVENAQGWLTGEPIVWNRANDSLTAKNQHMIFRQNLNGMAGTNSTVVKTNSPPEKSEKIDKPVATPHSPP